MAFIADPTSQAGPLARPPPPPQFDQARRNMPPDCLNNAAQPVRNHYLSSSSNVNSTGKTAAWSRSVSGDILCKAYGRVPASGKNQHTSSRQAHKPACPRRPTPSTLATSNFMWKGFSGEKNSCRRLPSTFAWSSMAKSSGTMPSFQAPIQNTHNSMTAGRCVTKTRLPAGAELLDLQLPKMRAGRKL